MMAAVFAASISEGGARMERSPTDYRCLGDIHRSRGVSLDGECVQGIPG